MSERMLYLLVTLLLEDADTVKTGTTWTCLQENGITNYNNFKSLSNDDIMGRRGGNRASMAPSGTWSEISGIIICLWRMGFSLFAADFAEASAGKQSNEELPGRATALASFIGGGGVEFWGALDGVIIMILVLLFLLHQIEFCWC